MLLDLHKGKWAGVRHDALFATATESDIKAAAYDYLVRHCKMALRCHNEREADAGDTRADAGDAASSAE